VPTDTSKCPLVSTRLEHPRKDSIPTEYWNAVYRDYALIEAVREVAEQLRIFNERAALARLTGEKP